MTLPRIVRQVCVFTDRLSDAQIERQIAATKDLASDNAKRIDIQHPDVFEAYHIYRTDADYPMYLLGPGAPRIETYQDALLHGDGCGQYIIVIREKDL